jgi:hypothetical protein
VIPAHPGAPAPPTLGRHRCSLATVRVPVGGLRRPRWFDFANWNARGSLFSDSPNDALGLPSSVRHFTVTEMLRCRGCGDDDARAAEPGVALLQEHRA